MEKIIARTKYNRKQHQQFYIYHMFFRNKSTYFMILIALFVIGWAIYNSFTMENPNDILISWGFSAFSLLMIPLLMTMRINEVIRKETPERKESTDKIEVTKDKIVRNNDKSEGKLVFGWNQVESVGETKDYIYIYTSPTQGIFIVKSDIIEGSVDLFRKIAKSNMKKNKRGKVNYKTHYKETSK